MFLDVTSKIVLPIIVSIVFLCLGLGILLWFILMRYKLNLMAKEIKVLEENLSEQLEEKKKILQVLLGEEQLFLDFGQTIKEKYEFNEQMNQIYQQCKEKEEEGSTEVLENLLRLENQLSLSIGTYNLKVAKFKTLIVEFPLSMVVGTKYNAIDYFGSMQSNESGSTC